FRFAWGLAADPPLNAMANNQAVSRPGTTGGAWSFFSFGTDPAAPSNMSWSFNQPAVTPSCGLPPPPPPPPGNDNCGSATIIFGVGTFSYDNRGATTDAGLPAPSCDPTSGRDAWFDWSAPCSGDFTVSLCAGATTDTILSVYDGPTCVGTE